MLPTSPRRQPSRLQVFVLTVGDQIVFHLDGLFTLGAVGAGGGFTAETVGVIGVDRECV